MIGPEEKVIELTEFAGIWARGNPDEVPQNHAVDCLNMKLNSKGQAITRFGTSILQAGPAGKHLKQFFQSGILPAPIASDTVNSLNWIFLDDTNNLYVNNGGSIYHLNGMSDFAALNLFNRTFISPNSGRFGFQNSVLLIYYNYNSTWILRPAAGAAPQENTAAFAAAQTVNPGDIPAGLHYFAVIYEMDTGYQTQPGPKLENLGVFTVTNGNPTTIASTVTFNPLDISNFTTGSYVFLSGATGAWVNLNGYWPVTVLDDFTITVPFDSSALGAFTGVLTIYGAFFPALLVCDGVHTVELTNIPTGPSYVTERIIIATQAGGTEFFFIPNGIIHDNTTTSLEINFFDTDLVISADSYFNLLEVIPSGTGLCAYNGTLVLVGTFPNFNTALVSNVSSPESFDDTQGYCEIPTESDGNNLVSCAVLRDILYLIREVGFWAAQDNGSGNPSTWPVTIVDGTVGSYQNGLCSFTSTISGASDTGDIILLASREGIYIFDGVVRRPELTFKIQDLYLQIPVAVSDGGQNRICVRLSVWTHQLFIAVPDSGTGYPSYLLVGDYDPLEGIIDPMAIRWSRYTFPWNPTAILTGSNLLFVSNNGPSGVIQIDPTETSDYGTVIIDNFYQTFFATVMFGWVIFFKGVRLRGLSNNNIKLTLVSLDGVTTMLPPAFVAAAGQEYLRLINFVNEKMSVKIETNVLNATLNINRVEIMGIPRWRVRPT
jgi:hypothetical protein